MARIWLAVVNIGLAVLASVPGFTDALVAAICVLTLGAMSAGVLHALVDIDLTCLSLPSGGTDTGETFKVFGFLTFSIIFTWADCTGS